MTTVGSTTRSRNPLRCSVAVDWMTNVLSPDDQLNYRLDPIEITIAIRIILRNIRPEDKLKLERPVVECDIPRTSHADPDSQTSDSEVK